MTQSAHAICVLPAPAPPVIKRLFGSSIQSPLAMRLQKGIAAADSKGVNDSLVLVDDIAFIVNVPSKTVVTAMDQAETNSNVFTNIDGAVIM